jgi:hypothetical protein
MVREGGFPEQGRTYSYSPDNPKDILNRSIDITRDFEFLVAVTGAFSSGKSTLLNLLLDRPDLLPASAIPMTAVCTVIRYGEQPRVRVRYVPFQDCFARVGMCIGQPFAKPFTGPEHLAEAAQNPENFQAEPESQESLRRFASLLRRYDDIAEPGQTEAQILESSRFDLRAPYMAGGGALRGRDGNYRYYSPIPTEEKEYLAAGGDPKRWVTKEWLALIRDVTLWVPSPLLANDIVFLDLPGLNCREDYHRRAIREYCNMADCILVVAFQPGNQADSEVIANFRKLSSNYHEKLFFVFNKVDQYTQEPDELVRAVDYLARDTIGGDFPQSRFFLTSAHLSRAYRSGDAAWRDDQKRLQTSLGRIQGALPGLDDWVGRISDPDDPGGIGHLKERLFEFLLDDAYQTKVSEVVRNYRVVLDKLREAASPSFEQSVHTDLTDILRKTVLDYFRHVEQLQHNAIYRFRYNYLRGHEDHGPSGLRQDLNGILDEVHRESERVIREYFDQPILSTPLLEDPVTDFDLLTIADEAVRNLRRKLQDLTIKSIHQRVCQVFNSYLEQCDFKQNLQNVFRGAPECVRRVDSILSRFETTMLHSHKGIVRTGFFHLPRGRQLKRLERSVPLSHMKETLVEIFTDFYPSWIFENIYGEVIERLWLSLFLDSEDLETEMAGFFRASESVITGVQIAEQAIVPPQLTDGSRDLYQSVRMCQQIEQLLQKSDALRDSATKLGVNV